MLMSYVDDLLKGFLDQCVRGGALLGRGLHTFHPPQVEIGHDSRSSPFAYQIKALGELFSLQMRRSQVVR